MQKQVSVIITTHNRPEAVHRAVKSVLNQTYQSIECIVVDDASDRENTCLLKKQADTGLIYHYISPENSKGGNHARNVGISLARGEYLAFLDDDDEWLEDKVMKQVGVFERNPDLGLVYCGSYIRYCDMKTYTTLALPPKEFKGDVSQKVFSRIFCRTSMIMIPRNVIEQVGGFDERLLFWQEYDLVIRICQKYQIAYVNEPLVIIDQQTRDHNRLSNKFQAWKGNLLFMEQKYAKQLQMLDVKTYKKWKSLGYYDAAARCEMEGKRDEQREYAWLAWKYDKCFSKFLIAFMGLNRKQINRLRELVDKVRRKNI